MERYIVEVLKTAEDEIIEACAWYEKQQTGLSKRLLAEVDQFLEQIAKEPFRFVLRYKSVYRIAVLKIFPYLIVFKISEAKQTVLVYSVFHTSRKPKQFKK